MRNSEKRTALRFSLLYVAAASLWVFLSDRLLGAFVADPGQLTTLQTYKGGVFVAVTGWLMYFLLKHELQKLGQIEAGLRASEERFRTLIASIDDFVFTLDRRQRHTGVYGRWLEKSSLRPAMFLGKTVPEILGDKTASIHESANQKALAGQTVVYEWIFELPPDRRFFQTSVSPLKDAAGEIVGVVGVGRDITNRKQTQEALQRERDFAESLIQTAEIIILVLDIQGRIVRFNPYLEKISGYRLAEAQGQDWFSIFLPEPTQEQMRTLFLQAIAESQTRSNVNTIITKDGRRLEIEWTNKPLKDAAGQAIGLLAVGQDITERVMTHQMLEQRVEERTRELYTSLEVSRKVVSTLELEPLLDLILDQLKTVVDYTSGAVLALSPQTNDLIVLAYRGPLPSKQALQSRVSGDVLRTNRELFNFQRPVIIDDIASSLSLTRVFQRLASPQQAGALSQVRSEMLVPLVVKERVMGLLGLSHKNPNCYSAEQAELVFAFASQVAVAVENARLYSETRKYVDELETLLTVQQAITRRLDPEAVLQLIADEARRLTDTRLSIVYLLDKEELRLAVFSGQPGPEARIGYRMPIAGSGAGLAIRSGRPILIPDAPRDPRVYADAIRRLGVCHCYLAVPLISASEPIGAIAVADKCIGRLSGNEEQIVTLLASGAVIALENARLYQKEHERRQALEALYRADEELYRYLDTDRVLQSLVDVAVDILQVDKSAALVWNADREQLTVQATRGFKSKLLTPMTFDGLLGRVAAGGEPVVVEDVRADARVATSMTEPEQICSFVHLPIKINGQVFGVFNVSYSQVRTFGDEEKRLFTSLAQRAALALENARLYEQAQQVAVFEERQRLARELHDAVTQNLFSATLIAEVLPELWELDRKEGEQLLEDLQVLSRGALAEMRTLLMELRPAALAEASLSDLLRQLAEAIMARTEISVKTSLEEAECPLSAEVRIGLYRIAQEALNNVVKHAYARQVTISLRCLPAPPSDPTSSGRMKEASEKAPKVSRENGQDKPIQLGIVDDGAGFDPATVSPERLGLKIMRERATAIGASLKVKSRPEQGTQVVVTWPGGEETQEDE